MMLVGNTWDKKLASGLPGGGASTWSVVGGVSVMPAPGCSRCTISNPSNSDRNDIVRNQPSVLAPTRPTDLPSPILAIPTASVANTSGAITILIMRRKTSVNNDAYSAYCVGRSVPAPAVCTAAPDTTPSTSAARINCVNRPGFCRPPAGFIPMFSSLSPIHQRTQST